MAQVSAVRLLPFALDKQTEMLVALQEVAAAERVPSMYFNVTAIEPVSRGSSAGGNRRCAGSRARQPPRPALPRPAALLLRFEQLQPELPSAARRPPLSCAAAAAGLALDVARSCCPPGRACSQTASCVQSDSLTPAVLEYRGVLEWTGGGEGTPKIFLGARSTCVCDRPAETELEPAVWLRNRTTEQGFRLAPRQLGCHAP